MAIAEASKRSVLWPLVATYVGFGWFWGTISVVYLNFIGARGFSNTQMAMHLLVLTIASVTTMILVAPRILHIVPGISIATAVALYGSGIALMVVLPNGWLFAAFAVAGLGTGMIDVLVNQVGHRFEVESETPVLQRVHMSYSLGAVGGALGTAAILVTLGGATYWLALLLAAGLQLIAVVACLTSEPLRMATGEDGGSHGISLVAFARHPALLATGLIVLSAFFVEGSLDLWAATYLRATLDATVTGAALGFAAFGIATAIGRGFAARILFGMGYKRTILLSGIGSAVAGVAIILAPNLAVATLAYLVLGFCLAWAGPAAFGSIEGGADAGMAIAAVTTMGYTGFVIGPPIMGPLSDHFGFRSTMIVITLATFGILLGGFLSQVRARRGDRGTS